MEHKTRKAILWTFSSLACLTGVFFIMGAIVSIPGGFDGPVPAEGETPGAIAGQLVWHLAQFPVTGSLMKLGSRFGLGAFLLIAGAMGAAVCWQALHIFGKLERWASTDEVREPRS